MADVANLVEEYKKDYTTVVDQGGLNLLLGNGRVLKDLFQLVCRLLSPPHELGRPLGLSQQKQVLMGICRGDASPLLVVQAYAGTGNTHLAMCLVCKLVQNNRLDDTNGVIIWAVELVHCGTRSCTP